MLAKTYNILAQQLRSDNIMTFFPPQGPPGFPGFPSFPGPQPGPSSGQPVFPGSQPGPPLGQPGVGSQGAPSSPPPAFIPQQPPISTFAVDSGAIVRCLFRNTYIWLRNGNQFWFFPIFVGRNSVAGFQWNGRF